MIDHHTHTEADAATFERHNTPYDSDRPTWEPNDTGPATGPEPAAITVAARFYAIHGHDQHADGLSLGCPPCMALEGEICPFCGEPYCRSADCVAQGRLEADGRWGGLYE